MCTITKKKKMSRCSGSAFSFISGATTLRPPKKINSIQHLGKKWRNLISAPSGLVWIPAAPFPSQSPHDYTIFCSQLSRCLHSGEITSDPLKWKTTAEGFSSALKIHLNWNMKFCCCRQLFVTYTGASFPGNTYSSIFLADTSEGQTLNI